MKDMVKKNQVMITALAIMIAIAGYLHFAGEVPEDGSLEASADVANQTIVEEQISIEDLMADYDLNSLADISDEDLEEESVDEDLIGEEEVSDEDLVGEEDEDIEEEDEDVDESYDEDFEEIISAFIDDIGYVIGTLLALVIFFFKDWIILIKAGYKKAVKKEDSNEGRIFWYLVAATIPAGILSLILDKVSDAMFLGINDKNRTMKETGDDMNKSYKETSEAGLAKININL